MTTITILGAGNLGHAMAGYLGLAGHTVRIWNRPQSDEVVRWLNPIAQRGAIQLNGAITGVGAVAQASTHLTDVVPGADVLIVCTTGDALSELATQLAPLLEESQCVLLLSPGTLGALEFARSLAKAGGPDVLIAETETTPFGSRDASHAETTISGEKAYVAVASLPGRPISDLLNQLPQLKFAVTPDVLTTSFDNVGPSLHVIPMMLNAARIEQREKFRYYLDGVTPSIANVIERFDAERSDIARAFGFKATSTIDYLVNVIGAPRGSLYTAIQGTPSYAGVKSPNTLRHRFLVEDSLTGLAPLLTLGEIGNVPTPLTHSFASITGAMLGIDYFNGNRSRTALGLGTLNTDDLRRIVTDGESFRNWRAVSFG